MGQKSNPIGLRLGITRTWSSRWYAAGDNYVEKLHQDLKIRAFITKTVPSAFLSEVIIERLSKKIKVTIATPRPAVIIGKKGEDINKIKTFVEKLTSDETSINIHEVKKPEVDAQIVAATIAKQIEGRASFKKVMKLAMKSAMKGGALGIKVSVAGRLGGTEIARTEWYKEGSIPLHVFKARIDYARASASTTYGIIGIKVWIYKGETKDVEY